MGWFKILLNSTRNSNIKRQFWKRKYKLSLDQNLVSDKNRFAVCRYLNGMGIIISYKYLPIVFFFFWRLICSNFLSPQLIQGFRISIILDLIEKLGWHTRRVSTRRRQVTCLLRAPTLTPIVVHAERRFGNQNNDNICETPILVRLTWGLNSFTVWK